MSIRTRDSQVIWHPYTPVKILPEAIGIARGEGQYLFSEDGNRYLDAISSWWVNLHGHAHPYINEHIRRQLDSLEHCIFAGFTHEPAVSLAERLLKLLPGEPARVFYSDNGSTAVEVALKMALQYWQLAQPGSPRKKIVAIEDAYHGDTFGAMSVSGRSIFTSAFSECLFDVSFIPFPALGREQETISVLRALVKAGDVAAFIAEPLVLGSGGMRMYSASVLEQMFYTCREHDTLIIADEVMTGFGRTDTLFACDQITTYPDIICLSKGLTGGYMPMGVTTTSARIFEAFLQDDRSKMLYHGHSFTANAAICAAANASLDLLLSEVCTAQRRMIAEKHMDFAQKLHQNPLFTNIRQTGTILAWDINAGGTGYHAGVRDKVYRYFLDNGILMRPLGNILYLIPPYCITPADLDHTYACIDRLMHKLQ
jgi:adenosylmethionine---8-amino-7-oxononanoate aminotransferase